MQDCHQPTMVIGHILLYIKLTYGVTVNLPGTAILHHLPPIDVMHLKVIPSLLN
ncbi:MAG TPA: hypothetical protein DCE56_36810 [Cyanobacteria bacterium UBA8553]|nr:hypothetical protein [Cyanobacteria bacterium UBA8553]